MNMISNFSAVILLINRQKKDDVTMPRVSTTIHSLLVLAVVPVVVNANATGAVVNRIGSDEGDYLICKRCACRLEDSLRTCLKF